MNEEKPKSDTSEEKYKCEMYILYITCAKNYSIISVQGGNDLGANKNSLGSRRRVSLSRRPAARAMIEGSIVYNFYFPTHIYDPSLYDHCIHILYLKGLHKIEGFEKKNSYI